MLERARSVVARHPALSAWFLTAAVLFAFLYALTKSLDFGLIAALFGAGLLTASAERFMLIPTPLDRRQWLMRLPVLNRIARAAHWLNPLYVGTFALVSPFPRDACRARLRLALTGAGWRIPGLFGSVIGGVRGDQFGMRRWTGWVGYHMFAVARGELSDQGPGTRIDLIVGLPAPLTYIWSLLVIGFVLFPVLLLLGSLFEALQRRTAASWALFASVAVVLSIVGAVVLVLSRLPLSWKRLAQVQETHLYLELLRTTVEAEPLDPTTAGAR